MIGWRTLERGLLPIALRCFAAKFDDVVANTTCVCPRRDLLGWRFHVTYVRGGGAAGGRTTRSNDVCVVCRSSLCRSPVAEQVSVSDGLLVA